MSISDMGIPNQPVFNTPPECHIHLEFVMRLVYCLIKTLLSKTQWDKTIVKEKEYSRITPPDVIIPEDPSENAYQSDA